MSPEQELPPELKSLEAALASLRPTPGGLDRDRLMFRAGEESARRLRMGRLVWPAACAASAGVAAALVLMLVSRPGPEVVERVVYVPAPQPAPAKAPPAPAPVGEPEQSLPPDARPLQPAALAVRLPGILGRVTPRAEYLRRLEEEARGPAVPSAAVTPRAGSSAAPPGPITYREILNSFRSGSDGPSADPTHALRDPLL